MLHHAGGPAGAPASGCATGAVVPPCWGWRSGRGRGFAMSASSRCWRGRHPAGPVVVGTSAGSLVAAIYASGRNGAQLQQIALEMEEATLTDWTLPCCAGVLRGDALARYVNQQVRGLPIEQMPLALGVVATDLHSGDGIPFRRGDTGTAVRASSAIPAIFQPVRIGSQDYVDGGLVAGVPVQYARQMGAEGRHCCRYLGRAGCRRCRWHLQVLLQTFSIMGRSINRHELASADVVVRPASTRSAALASRSASVPSRPAVRPCWRLPKLARGAGCQRPIDAGNRLL